MTPVELFELFAVGTAAGVIGSLVGLGGGFLVVPVLRIAFAIAPAATAGAALVMVLANALSGSLAYLRQRRVDIRAGLLIAATGIPAGVAGAVLVHYVSFTGYDLLYSALLVYVAVDALRRRAQPSTPRPRLFKGLPERVLRDAQGIEYHYSESVPALLAAGLVMGFASSFFGIGGGTIVVPALMIFNVPAHIVTATSAFAILLTAPIGVVAHQAARDIDWALAIPLAAGGLLGGQIGPRIAQRLSSGQLLSILAGTLLAAALALLLKHI